jgi:hypothetical protein
MEASLLAPLVAAAISIMQEQVLHLLVLCVTGGGKWWLGAHLCPCVTLREVFSSQISQRRMVIFSKLATQKCTDSVSRPETRTK